MKRLTSSLALLALLLVAGQAKAGNAIVVGFGLMHGTADIAAQQGSVNSAFQTPEIGGRFEYWNQMKENYALNFAFNYGFSAETDKLRDDAAPLTQDAKFTTQSISFRLGGDRTWNPIPTVTMFMGPGIEYWNGKAKFENIGGAPGTYETESTTRVSLHGHLGAHFMMGDAWGLSGQMGHKLGMASYTEAGGKSTWWPNSIDGSMELIFKFGGK
ncbi:MAG: outer membrane beta-barrel protein [Candidatus Eisenbacteria bacterium]